MESLKVHICFVDDETELHCLMDEFFKKDIREGLLRVSYSESGQECLDLLDSGIGEDVIIIISDINMPGMDGFQLMEAVRKKYPQISLMVCSAYGDEEHRNKASKHGAELFFSKPVDFDKLREAIFDKVKELASA